MSIWDPSIVVQARESLSLSQRKFADVIGVHYTTIANWERGHKEPSKMAKTLLNAVIVKPEIFSLDRSQLPTLSSR